MAVLTINNHLATSQLNFIPLDRRADDDTRIDVIDPGIRHRLERLAVECS